MTERPDESPDAEPAPSGSRRRLFLIGVAAASAAAWLSWPQLRTWLAVEFEFTPIADPAGFRSFGSGTVSTGFNLLAGIESPPVAESTGSMASVRADLCQALFGSRSIPPGTVPLAYFTDFRCPYCRVLGPRLAALEASAGNAVRVTWHEWPILGDASKVSSRAALAARQQGAYRAVHERLMIASFFPTPVYLADLARRVGLDPERLFSDMDGPEVSRELAMSEALAGIFRFRGTPSLLIGRTLVQGAIDDATLAALIDRERTEGPPPGCASG